MLEAILKILSLVLLGSYLLNVVIVAIVVYIFTSALGMSIAIGILSTLVIFIKDSIIGKCI